ncbi:MAG: hypothetical protein QW639_03620 [Candidatus Bathyarchaeia archaeon]
MILDFTPDEIYQFMEFLQRLPYTSRYNFIIYEWRLLDNKTFADFLRSRGELIPFFSYPQLLPVDERMAYLDHYLHEFKRMVGVYPNGSFMFQPDTFSVQYMRGKYGLKYVAGYCFDQLLIDHMSMLGGWQAPYYSNESNVLLPSQIGRGVVVFPHVTWDWIGRYKDHHYNLHPQNAYLALGRDKQKALIYMERLASETLASLEPFGYIAVTFEFKHLGMNYGLLDMAQKYFHWLISESGGTLMTFSETADWFMKAYPSNPEYLITFTSPSTSQTITWLFNKHVRIAIVDGRVVSLIDYTKQQPDPFLRAAASLDPLKPPTRKNVIDTSLKSDIDLLSGKQPPFLHFYNPYLPLFLLFYIVILTSLHLFQLGYHE